jgi:hypothetical protein
MTKGGRTVLHIPHLDLRSAIALLALVGFILTLLLLAASGAVDLGELTAF